MNETLLKILDELKEIKTYMEYNNRLLEGMIIKKDDMRYQKEEAYQKIKKMTNSIKAIQGMNTPQTQMVIDQLMSIIPGMQEKKNG